MILLVSGTNRPGSQTLRVTKIFKRLYEQAGAQAEILDLQELPHSLFQPSAYEKKPAEFVAINAKVLSSSGLVIVTPEYNGSFPGVLKYFVDMLQFPESFDKRPVAFVGLAAGMFGALRSVEQLELIFAYRNAFLFNERIFLPKVGSQLNEKDEFVVPLTEKLAKDQVTNFIRFCDALKPVR